MGNPSNFLSCVETTRVTPSRIAEWGGQLTERASPSTPVERLWIFLLALQKNNPHHAPRGKPRRGGERPCCPIALGETGVHPRSFLRQHENTTEHGFLIAKKQTPKEYPFFTGKQQIPAKTHYNRPLRSH